MGHRNNIFNFDYIAEKDAEENKRYQYKKAKLSKVPTVPRRAK